MPLLPLLLWRYDDNRRIEFTCTPPPLFAVRLLGVVLLWCVREEVNLQKKKINEKTNKNKWVCKKTVPVN